MVVEAASSFWFPNVIEAESKCEDVLIEVILTEV
jgi:hypothetical protein